VKFKEVLVAIVVNSYLSEGCRGLRDLANGKERVEFADNWLDCWARLPGAPSTYGRPLRSKRRPPSPRRCCSPSPARLASPAQRCARSPGAPVLLDARDLVSPLNGHVRQRS